MSRITRKECRESLASFLIAALSEYVAPEWVLDYQKTDFQGATPVVQVTSSGVDLDLLLRTGKTLYFATIESFVIHKHEESGWTEAMAEDLIDDISEVIVECLKDVRTNGPWKTVYLSERTLVTRQTLSGLTYLYEVFPIIMEVM